MIEDFSEEIQEDVYFYDNQKWAEYVAFSFGVLGVITVLIIGQDIIRYLGVFQTELLGYVLSFSYLGSFFICIIFYLIWYQKINENYLTITNQEIENDYKGSIFFWFIPFLNIVFPFMRIKATKKAYKNILTKTEKVKKNIFLEVWAISFLLRYLISIFIIDNLPILPDDIDLYYVYNPGRLLLENGISRLLELIGLFSMFKIVNNIQMLETNFIEQDGETNLLDHLIE